MIAQQAGHWSRLPDWRGLIEIDMLTGQLTLLVAAVFSGATLYISVAE
jgi:hypothetical protein